MRILAFIPILLLTACGIESFENMDAPNTPMGLTAFSSNKYIYLTFTAYNPLDTFSGYNVYTGNTETEVRTAPKPLTNDSWIAYPYTNMRPFTNVRTISLTIKGFAPNHAFIEGNWVYIGVAAYDSVNSRISGMSEIVNIQITN